MFSEDKYIPLKQPLEEHHLVVYSFEIFLNSCYFFSTYLNYVCILLH